MGPDFYDSLSPFYHLIFEDWEGSIQRQADLLDALIQKELGHEVKLIHDASCGIGTQSIGLAQKGYQVSASDLSPQAIKRACFESQKRGLDIDYQVADMRDAPENRGLPVDLLISCDNSIPHLLSDHDILKALKSFYDRIKPGGSLLLSLRDYSKAERDEVQLKPYALKIENGIKYILFQTWEFLPHTDIYHLSMYLIQDDGKSAPETQVFRTQYYAIGLNQMLGLIQEVGFVGAKEVPSEYYQPILIAEKPVS